MSFWQDPDQSHIDQAQHVFHVVLAMPCSPSHLLQPVGWFVQGLSRHLHTHYKYMRPRPQSVSRLQTAFYRKMNNVFVLEDVRTYSLHK